MDQPLVTVICLCYNQSRFVEETLQSVFDQSYNNIEIIVVDDGSTDGSKETIRSILENRSEVQFVDLSENLGNTKAFNQGFKLAKGKFVVDLACDDVLLPDRIQKQVCFFGLLTHDYGVIYSDAQYISESGKANGRHFESKIFFPYKGRVFREVVAEFFIPPPTMMIRREVLDELNGYDEDLAYEDFDFWVRSARNWKYGYQNEILTKIRQVEGSHSQTLYEKGDRKLDSTIRICEKIENLVKNDLEKDAYIRRLKYELKHAFLTGNRDEANEFYQKLKQQNGDTILEVILMQINRLGINWSFLRNAILKIRY